jgi:hypothetical protein
VLTNLRTRAVPLAGVLAGLLATTLTGCQLFSEKQTAEPGPAYPETMPRGTTVPIQVFRDVTTLRMTNTTAQTFGPGRLWLNKQHSIAVETFDPGETWELNLKDFVDDFGDVYRAGGFFAQREPASVVLVEIENGPADNRELVGFVVVDNKFN